jgi:hypothetical protein
MVELAPVKIRGPENCERVAEYLACDENEKSL